MKNVENIITTNRLILTPMEESDIEFIFMLEKRIESYQYDSDNEPTSEEVIKRCKWFIERAKSLPNEGAIRWIVRKDNIMIGEVHFTCNYEKTHEWEIGYKFIKEEWGNGFASEAVKAVIKYAFEHFNVNRIVAFLNVENKRSEALVERVGLIKEGCLREVRIIGGKYYNEYIYSILKWEVGTR